MENSPSLAPNATNPPPNTTTTATSTTLESPSIPQPTAPASTSAEASSAPKLKSEPIHIIDLDSEPEEASSSKSKAIAETSTSTTTTRPPGETDEEMTAVSGHEEPLDVEDALDPLSHLSSIFDKIRKQVIEWGEDANWKIDVFLLPNEDQANGQSTPISTPKLPPSQPPNQPPLPHHPQAPLVDHGNRQRIPGPYPARELSPPPAMDRGARRYPAPPPHMPPSSLDERRLLNLQEADIVSMTMMQAKRALSSAVHHVRAQKDLLYQYMQDLDAMQRMSAKRERDAEARLEVEKQIMERNAAVLSKKWQEAAMNDVQAQLETGKRLIKERNAERKKIFDEKGISMPHGSVAPEISNALRISTSNSEEQAPLHKHRHRHVHYHRHHHRHLQRKRQKLAHQAEVASFDGLAALASEASLREHVLQSSSVHKQSDYIKALMEADKRPLRPEDKDRGLQLRSVVSTSNGLLHRSSSDLSGYPPYPSSSTSLQRSSSLLNGRGFTTKPSSLHSSSQQRRRSPSPSPHSGLIARASTSSSLATGKYSTLGTGTGFGIGTSSSIPRREGVQPGIPPAKHTSGLDLSKFKKR
ncbi:hypothetical protein BGZ74_000413 [Mortierella antarctica]|nr:hypothetical protein BGZ74_000413 [Mortierella antarctica]